MIKGCVGAAMTAAIVLLVLSEDRLLRSVPATAMVGIGVAAVLGASTVEPGGWRTALDVFGVICWVLAALMAATSGL